jgi:hypothetical protein
MVQWAKLFGLNSLSHINSHAVVEEARSRMQFYLLP